MTDGTLYGWAVATCTQKVLVVAHELGLDLNLSLINLMTGDQKKPPHINRQVCFYYYFIFCFLFCY